MTIITRSRSRTVIQATENERLREQVEALRETVDAMTWDLFRTKRLLRESEEARKLLENRYRSLRAASSTRKARSTKAAEYTPQSNKNDVNESLGQILPHELIMIVADMLSNSHSYRTLGMLGLVSRTVHEDVSRLFYGTMVCDRGWQMDWDLKNGRMIRKALKELPLDKWRHATCLIQDATASLLHRRSTYFPKLALGITKDASEGGEVLLTRQITRETFTRHLSIPLMWAGTCCENDWTVSPLRRLSTITISPDGGILPDASPTPGSPVPLICNPSGAILRTLSIVFERGSTANNFENTVRCIFDMIDSRLDPATDILTPRVSIRILDGLEGLRRFMPLLEPILKKHLGLDISVTAVESSSPFLPPPDDAPQLQPSPTEEFVAHMKTIRDIFQSNWHDLRSFRHVGPEPRSLEIIFDLMVEFLSPDGPGLDKVFQGMVDDTEEEGQPPTLSVTAESKDLHTRQLAVLWEDDIAGAPLPLV